jgi:chromosome segregation ATPase
MSGALMAADESRVFAAIGSLETQIKHLSERFDALEERTTVEQNKVHDIVDATSEAVRNLTRLIAEMKPLTDDYRERRAEQRGEDRINERVSKYLYAAASAIGGIVVFAAGKIFDWLTKQPPPPPPPGWHP